ncbi:M15 family metallopeptidase [Amphibacillus sediminis]|uniref:M15 family metallopeptidase n=1 Tax=Amphibacillus sediminis TaxID=360185 RepID=UPI00082FCDC1|nr:M15 family metallopeptidase [Amphibacillus sediminis]
MKKIKWGLVLVSLCFALTGGQRFDQESQQNITSSRTHHPKEELEVTEEITLAEEHFNTIETINGQNVILNPDNIMVFVNPDYSLPDAYQPDDLVIPNVRFSFDEDVDKRYLRKEAAIALEQLFIEAENNGYKLYAVSGYRSFQRQIELYQNAINNYGPDQSVSASPGQSEHQTGLAMDISSANNGFALNEDFGLTEEGKWVAENAHRFGFIIRYPEGKETITGFSYEPWHLRYVGSEVAEILYKNHWTLEEYFDQVRPV